MQLQNRKVVIIGAGHVGSHAGFTLIAQGLVDEIVYIDVDEKKAQAQALDLTDSTAYLPSRAKVRVGTYADAADAPLMIVAAGPLPDLATGQTRMDTLRQTIAILKHVTEQIKASGFSGIIVNISNPADVVTHYIQTKLNWPSQRIFSTSTTLAAALAALTLTACGGNNANTSGSQSAASGSSADASTAEPVTVKLGIVGGINEDLWAPAKATLAEEGIDLELVNFSDYVTPNRALNDGEIDLNAFQHRIYLQGEIDSYGYEIQNIGNTFIAPLSLFSDKISSVDELKDGDVIAIPNDLTNGGRALKVLESAGIITLDPNAGFNPTVDDIQTYNVGVTIKELKANVIVSTLPDVTAAIVNNNYALDFGLAASDAIFADDRLDIEDYWNLIAARTADLSDPAKVEVFRKVVDAYQSDETLAVYNDQCKGFYTPAGWDQDLLPQA